MNKKQIVQMTVCIILTIFSIGCTANDNTKTATTATPTISENSSVSLPITTSQTVSDTPNESQTSTANNIKWIDLLGYDYESVTKTLEGSNVSYEQTDNYSKQDTYNKRTILVTQNEKEYTFTFFIDSNLVFALNQISFAVDNANAAYQEALSVYGDPSNTWSNDNEEPVYSFLGQNNIYYTLYSSAEAYAAYSNYPLSSRSPLESIYSENTMQPEYIGISITAPNGITKTFAPSTMFGIDDVSDALTEMGETYQTALDYYVAHSSANGPDTYMTDNQYFTLVISETGEWEISLQNTDYNLYDLIKTGNTMDTMVKKMGTPQSITFSEQDGYCAHYQGRNENESFSCDIYLAENGSVGNRVYLDVLPS